MGHPPPHQCCAPFHAEWCTPCFTRSGVRLATRGGVRPFTWGTTETVMWYGGGPGKQGCLSFGNGAPPHHYCTPCSTGNSANTREGGGGWQHGLGVWLQRGKLTFRVVPTLVANVERDCFGVPQRVVLHHPAVARPWRKHPPLRKRRRARVVGLRPWNPERVVPLGVQRTVSTRSAHGQHTVSMRSAHGEHTVSTRSAKGQHTNLEHVVPLGARANNTGKTYL